MSRPRTRALLGLLLASGALLAIALSGDLKHRAALFACLYAVAVAGYVLLLSAPSRLRLRLVVLVAVAVRLAFVPGTPSLSDDYHRYVWDGRVQVAGVNPYRYPPSSHRLDQISYPDRGRINHPAQSTIYPPLAELLFFGVAAAGGGLLALKVIFGVLELLTAGALALLVVRARRTEALTLYLLCPLVVIETWSSAHLETTAVLLVVLAAALVRRGRDGGAGVALGLAAAFKVTPAFLLVPALLGHRARPTRFLPGFALAWGLPYVPYLLSGGASGSLGSVREDTGGLGFFLLHRLLSYGAAAAVCAALAVAGAALIARRLPGRPATAAAFAWSATILLLGMPIVHSWYWLAPVALALAAGLRLPLYLGLAGPAAEVAGLRWGGYRGWVHLLTYSPLLAGLPALVHRVRRPPRGNGAGQQHPR